MIRETVDVHADAGVDIVSLCFFARYSTGMPRCRTAQTWKPTPDIFPRPANDHLYNGLVKLGDRDRMQIVVDQCHKRDIKCIANLRMNDPRFLRFGDNTIAAAVKTTRKRYHVEIDRFILCVRPRR